MYFPGVGEIVDRGFLENGPGKDVFRYPLVEEVVDTYASSVEKTFTGKFQDYFEGVTPPGSDAPESLSDARRRARDVLDHNVPPLAEVLLLQAYKAGALEGPVAPTDVPPAADFETTFSQ